MARLRSLATSAGLGFLLALSSLAAGSLPPVQAQTDATFSGMRALNLARNRAVKLNGGLSVYRPAACMFSTEWGGSGCLVRQDGTGFLFRFLGGPPGWEQLKLAPTVETEILIAPDGRQVVEVLHNGPPRQGSAPPASTTAPAPAPAPTTQGPRP